MSTPIEIVRAHRLSLAYPNAGIATQAYAKEIAALDAVLRDAERFKALEAQNAGLRAVWQRQHEYVQLLEKELSDVMPLASVHGYVTKRAEAGLQARIAINLAIAALNVEEAST